MEKPTMQFLTNQELSYKEYDKYRLKQDRLYVSHYDRFIEETKKLEE